MIAEKSWQRLVKGAQDKNAEARLGAWSEFAECFRKERDAACKSRENAGEFGKAAEKLYPLALRALDNEVRYTKSKITELSTSLSLESVAAAGKEAVMPFYLLKLLCEILDALIITALDCSRKFKTERLPKEWLEETSGLIEELMKLLVLLGGWEVRDALAERLDRLQADIGKSLR